LDGRMALTPFKARRFDEGGRPGGGEEVPKKVGDKTPKGFTVLIEEEELCLWRVTNST